MNVKEIRIRKFENGSTLGFATVIFDNGLVITGCVIRKGSYGRFVKLPEDGKYYPLVYFDHGHKDKKQEFEKLILEEYDKN